MHIAALPAGFIHVKLASYTCIIRLKQMLTYCSEILYFFPQELLHHLDEQT